MRRLPPLGAIEAFVTVARSGSIKAAADALSLSSSAISRRVQTLETHLDTLLFERRHQALILTPHGAGLMEALSPILDNLADTLDRASRPHEGPRLRLGVAPFFATQRLMPRLPGFIAAHPGFHLDIETTAKPQSDMGTRIDASIWLGDTPDPRFYARQLDTNRIIAVASPDVARSIRSPADLKGRTIFLHRETPSLLEIWRAHHRNAVISDADISVSDSGQLMIDATAAGLGISVILDKLVEDDTRLEAIFADEDIPSPFNYWFLCRKNGLDQRPVRMFHDWLFGEFSH